MFEITAEDISLLNDGDLRSLVGRLCESKMMRREISPSCVTWGGIKKQLMEDLTFASNCLTTLERRVLSGAPTRASR